MSFSLNKCGLLALRYTLAIVILIEAILFVMPGAAREFTHTHIPGFVRLIIGFGESLGSILLLVPQTAVRGAWLLLAVFVMAILIHLLHGQYNVGNVVIYAAAAFAIATGK
jgi:type II secretory pathway component PulF